MQFILSSVLPFLYSALAFILILVPLVVFHEFGHFIFAKLFGVKAEVFSVGFGKKLWSKQIGETEFCLSAIPLGGYVKLLGEDRDQSLSVEEQKRALHRQKPWKRFLIFFGGPLFNFILAIFIFMVILVLGEPQMASFVGRVVHHSPAEKMGFKSGDEIVAINQKPVRKFEEVLIALNESPNHQLTFDVKHAGGDQVTQIVADVASQQGVSVYGEKAQVGDIEGLLPMARSTQIGVSNSQSLAAQAGLKTGDVILDLNQKRVENWEVLESLYQSVKPLEKVTFTLQKKNKKTEPAEKVSVTWAKPSDSQGDLGLDFGLFSSELFIDKVLPHSPAEKMGLLSGDRLISVGTFKVESFFQLREKVQFYGETQGKVQLEWERNGSLKVASIEPTGTEGRDHLLNKVIHYTVGVMPMLVYAEPKVVIEKIYHPITLLSKATSRMLELTSRHVISMKKMFSGEVSMGALSGPIMIGKVAGESMARGLIVFLTNMSIFSIGLGILNILPIPVLDGGHLLLLAVESIRRKPLSNRQMEIVQGLGLIFILTLMGIAFHNDIARLIYSS